MVELVVLLTLIGLTMFRDGVSWIEDEDEESSSVPLLEEIDDVDDGGGG